MVAISISPGPESYGLNINMKDLRKNIHYVLKNLEKVQRVRKTAFALRKHLIDLTLNHKINEKDFYKITSLLSPQSRSVLWQNYYIKKHHCIKVPVASDRGDFIQDKEYYEYKSSGFNSDDSLNIVQIREWQNCSYIIQSIQNTGAVWTFKLTADEMKKEVLLCKASVAHGTKISNIQNKNIEKRMTIQKGDKNWLRWKRKYSI